MSILLLFVNMLFLNILYEPLKLSFVGLMRIRIKKLVMYNIISRLNYNTQFDQTITGVHGDQSIK
jgi:hypothetical protein